MCEKSLKMYFYKSIYCTNNIFITKNTDLSFFIEIDFFSYQKSFWKFTKTSIFVMNLTAIIFMKKLLTTFVWVLSIGFLQSCNESIAPAVNPAISTDNRVVNVTQTLLSNSWQFNEISIQAGENAKMLFSRPRHIGLNNSIINVSLTFKTDGTVVSQNESGVSQKGTWKLTNYDTLLSLTFENQATETFEVEAFEDKMFKYSTKLEKEKTDAATWSSTLSLLQASEAVTEIKTIYKLSSI